MTKPERRIDFEVKFASSDEKGQFTGYASTFEGEPDSYGDIIAPGAFTKSLVAHNDAGTTPLMLWQHRMDQPIGVWQSLKEDENGLAVSGNLVLETRRGKEAYGLLKAGALSGLSIGFRINRFENLEGGGRRLLELDLLEISLVSLPAASRARVTNVKKGKTDMSKPTKKTGAEGDLLEIEARAAKLEQRNEAFGERLDTLETSIDEVRSSADQIQKLFNRQGLPNGKGGDDEAAVEAKAFASYLRRDRDGMQADELKTLVVADDTNGGYLAPAQFVNEVIKGITEISPVRQAARITSSSANSLILPKRTGKPTASWVGETEDRSETKPSYGQLEIPAHEAGCYVDVSRRLLEDSAVNIEREVASDLAEEFGRLEGVAFVSGDGSKKPTGFLSDKSIASTKTGSATSLGDNPDETLVDLMYAMPAFYRASGVWMMNAQTIAIVRKLKDADGRFLWSNSLQDGQPALLLGRPVIEAPDMDNIGSNKCPIIFGNFQRGYRINDRLQLSIMRDPFTMAGKGLVRYHARRRVGGNVVLAEAFRKLKCAA